MMAEAFVLHGNSHTVTKGAEAGAVDVEEGFSGMGLHRPPSTGSLMVVVGLFGSVAILVWAEGEG